MAVLRDQIEQAPNAGPAVVEARIDDSSKPKTCHQCRQKRTDLVGSCVIQKKHTTCPLKFCTKCIKNRYGEEPEEVALKTDWVCPKCRGDCNCSFCMTKRGKKPTGVLVHTAKKNGCSSVSELLRTEGSDRYVYKKKAKPEEGAAVASPPILDLENAIEQKPVSIKRSKKTKRGELKEIDNGNGCSDENAAVEKSIPKKIKISDSVPEAGVTKKVSAQRKETTAKNIKGKNIAEAAAKDIKGNNIVETTAEDIEGNNIAGMLKRTKPALKRKEEDRVEVKLPQGNSVITVAGIDFAPEDVGNVLQFLEFCSAFGKALDLRKGQAECVLREMFSGRSRTRQQYSTLTQMIIQLLTVIFEGRGETSVCLSATDASWFTAVGECLSVSEVKLDDFPPEMFEKGISQYEKLDSSKRLRLLNFLCDETLGTSLMRNYIDSQHDGSVKKEKEAKEKINAAREKEKQLKQKLQDEVAKAVTEKNGIPLTITEYDAIVSPMNAEIEEVHSEMQSAVESKKSQGSGDALRTIPVELDENGLIFWKLKSYNDEQNILLQDLGSSEQNGEVCPREKWFSFSSEQKPEIEKYISSIRMKRCRAIKNSKTIMTS